MNANRQRQSMYRLQARLRRAAEFRAARLARCIADSQPIRHQPAAQPRPIAPSNK